MGIRDFIRERAAQRRIAKRNKKIVALSATGVPYVKIGRKFGLSGAQVARIVKKALANGGSS